jgi:hypothetical protein
MTSRRSVQEQMHALMQTKRMIEQLKAIEQATLTEREREVVRETLAHAYDRAHYLLTAGIVHQLESEEALGHEKGATHERRSRRTSTGVHGKQTAAHHAWTSE